MAGTDLFTHIRYMMYTTMPTLAITLIIFSFGGLRLTQLVLQPIAQLFYKLSNRVLT